MRLALPALLLLAPACVSSDRSGEGDSGGGDGGFAGLHSATWNGADGLVGAWEGEGAEVTLEVSGVDGTVVATAASTSGSATLTGLEEGEYVVRAWGTDGDDGGRALHQWVGSNRLVYRSESAVAGGARTVHGEGGLVAVGGGTVDDGQVVLYDLSSGAEATMLGKLSDLGEVSDVAVQGSLLAVATDTTLHPEAETGVRVYDLADPGTPLLRGSIPATQDNAHTLTFGESGILYLASTLNAWIAVYDVSESGSPRSVSSLRLPQPSSVHDQTWANGQLWIAYTTGLAVADTTDPANLELIGVLPASWPDAFVHNLWPTADGLSLAMSEEAVSGSLRVVDIRDLNDMQIVAEVETAPEHSIHDVVVRDHYAFAAWYTDGLLVWDLSDPTAPVLVGQFDTWSGSEVVEQRSDGTEWPNVNGAAHVWPMGRHIAVADSQRGLVVFDFFPETIQWGETWGGNEGVI